MDNQAHGSVADLADGRDREWDVEAISRGPKWS
jgi:hypothetical protein